MVASTLVGKLTAKIIDSQRVKHQKPIIGVKLNSTGSALLYSTYLGGSNSDEGFSIAVETSGNAYVTGRTSSSDFPTTPGVFQTVYSGGLLESFITELNSTGSALVYSTYLGGSLFDESFGIALDALGDAYVTGVTFSSNFPTTPGAFQTSLAGSYNAFVTKLNSTGSALLYSTYLGGSYGDWAESIAVNAPGNAYITGFAASSNFPTTPGAFQTTLGGIYDAFVTKLALATFAGQPGAPNCHGVSVSALSNQYGTIGAAASALGFPSVQALQNAIMAFCAG